MFRLAWLILFVFALLPRSVRGLIYCDNNCATNGYYCIADDPGAFSVCSNGYRVGTLHCQTGLWWDVNLNTCNWPSAVDSNPQCPCGLTTTTTTTPKVTTSTSTLPPGASTTPPTTRPPSPDGLKRVCYFTNWSVYRPGPASYWAGDVDPYMCTHIIVAFMNLNNGQISYLETADADTFATLTKMRDTQNPSLKIMAAIGGWNAGSWPFIGVVSTPEAQDAFIAQAISFLRQNNLDGLDIDWEYPTGYINQFSQWMTKMNSAFANESIATGQTRLLLSAAVSAGQATIDYAYDVPTLSQAVDMIMLMSYDLNGPWNPTTGLNSGIYPQGSTDPFNIAWCSNYWIQKGADPKKLIVGIPTYSRTFKLCNPGPSQTGIGSKACGTGNEGPFTQSPGFEAYYETCLKLQCSSGNWTSVWSSAGIAPFMYSGNQWISYENATSIAAKVQFVMAQNYGGVMVWAVDLDDFGDICGYGVKSPLMSTLVAVATGQPLPTFNAVPSPAVNPCDPTNSGVIGGGSATGTGVDLSICDNNCAKDGLYCVPDNIYAFYQCSNGVRYGLQYCQSSLNYNYLYSACDWPVNYPGCNCVIPSSTTTTTSTTATTTTGTSSVPDVNTTTITTTSSSQAPSTTTTTASSPSTISTSTIIDVITSSSTESLTTTTGGSSSTTSSAAIRRVFKPLPAIMKERCFSC